jgi:hypothetical protein
LSFLQSSRGHKNAAGAISRYLTKAEIDGADLERDVEAMAKLFEPLLLRNWHGDGGDDDLFRGGGEADPPPPDANGREFAEAFQAFLTAFASSSQNPFAIHGELRHAIDGLRDWFSACRPVSSRPTIKVEIGVGKGGWTNTPWIALLDKRVTSTTQGGTYIVFLISEDLAITYLTLNQGVTHLKNELGQPGARAEMVRVAEAARPRYPRSGTKWL